MIVKKPRENRSCMTAIMMTMSMRVRCSKKKKRKLWQEEEVPPCQGRLGHPEMKRKNGMEEDDRSEENWSEHEHREEHMMMTIMRIMVMMMQ